MEYEVWSMGMGYVMWGFRMYMYVKRARQGSTIIHVHVHPKQVDMQFLSWTGLEPTTYILYLYTAGSLAEAIDMVLSVGDVERSGVRISIELTITWYDEGGGGGGRRGREVGREEGA